MAEFVDTLSVLWGQSPSCKIQSVADSASSPISAFQIASCQRSAHVGYAAEYLIRELPDDFLVICDANSLTYRLHQIKPKTRSVLHADAARGRSPS